MFHPGPIADFNRFPSIWPGPTGPLLFNPGALTQTPEIYRIGVGRLVTFRRWGRPVGYFPPGIAELPAPVWAKGPDQPWGLGRSTAQLDDYDQYQAPAAASEKVRVFDRQRCTSNSGSVDPIVPTGATFELIRYDIPSQAVGILNRIPTVLEVEATDQGVPIFTYGGLNGERPCLDELRHPDPAVTLPLTWLWRVTTTDNGPGQPYQGPIRPGDVFGDDLIEPWRDLRNGHGNRWPDHLHYVMHPRKTLHYWVTLFGPTNRFRVTVGGRFGGYWQTAGRRGAAIRAATERYS